MVDADMTWLVEEHTSSYDGGSEQITFHIEVDADKPEEALELAGSCKRGGFLLDETQGLTEAISGYLWVTGENPIWYEIRKVSNS
jgi:hypothetical protein